MPRHPFAVSFLATSLTLGAATGATAFPAVSDSAFHYPPPSATELARVKAEFRDAAARSASERSGQIFYLPAKYNMVGTRTGYCDGTTHIHGKFIKTNGTSHGVTWEYDTHIPIVLWGPGFVREGVRTEAPATQQDLVPTYAHLMGTLPPEDATGRVLKEALKPGAKHPKVILTLVFDQAGEVYYRAHPGLTPNIDRLKREGTYYTSARVTHLDAETGIGHTAIGTGAWPAQTGIPSNSLWMKGLGGERYSFWGENDTSPIFVNSPSLADLWLKKTHNKAMVAGYCYADRAVIGMIGHGSLFRGNKKPYGIFYDEKVGQLTTNEAFYTLPPYLKGLSPKPYLDKLTNGTGVWMQHPIEPKAQVRTTPAYADFDGDNVVSLIEHEPWGTHGVTDLMFVTLKSTDAGGHAYGHESDEAADILADQDKQVGRIVKALADKVGADNVLVALTADHGSTPLQELSHGALLPETRLLGDLNRRFDKVKNGADLFEYASATQLFLNEAEMKRNHLTYEQVKKALLGYKFSGKPFFVDAVTRDEAEALARKKGWAE
jgi:hypothetical protein